MCEIFADWMGGIPLVLWDLVGIGEQCEAIRAGGGTGAGL
jgi:hypothetical protein